jgi:hypothetical protein
MQPADNLMLSGVLAHCPDCAVETIFVAPDPLDADPLNADPLDAGQGEHACTICGAAVLIDLSGPAPCDRVAHSA